MAPVLRWNAAHDWIAFTFQLSHGYGDGGGGGVPAVAHRVFEFVGGQLLVTAVLPGLAMLTATVHALRGSVGAPRQLVAVVATTAFAPFAVSAFRQHGEPNWTAVAYPALFILLAVADGSVWTRRRLRYGLGLAAALVAIGYVRALGVVPITPQVARYDPFAEAYGWNRLA
jgi:hypothetical protein